MSYSISSAIALCEIAPMASAQDVALAVYDYLVNHPDDIPCDLDDYDSDEVVEIIESYLSLDGNKLTIAYDTEEANGRADIFDFLASHFAQLQTSLFMEVTWICNDLRNGASGHTDYYDRDGKLIDAHEALTAYLAK